MKVQTEEGLVDAKEPIRIRNLFTMTSGYGPTRNAMLQDYPDVTVIVDAKMATTTEDAAVIQRLDALQEIYHIDLSERILPEIFSVEMWQQLEGKVSFRQFLFSRYKEYYDITTVTESFPVGTDGVISVFALGGDARGVTLEGLQYPLKDGVLSCGFPLGVSNHFLGEAASITAKGGSLLVLWDRKNGLPQIHRQEAG